MESLETAKKKLFAGVLGSAFLRMISFCDDDDENDYDDKNDADDYVVLRCISSRGRVAAESPAAQC